MTGRSNWEHKNNPGTATERLARALNRPVNEAIKVEPKKALSSDVKATATPGLLGDGAASRAMRKVRARLPE
jgi:hypothetical protein